MDEFTIRKHDGQVSGGNAIRSHINILPDGEYVVQVRKATRSLSQNNLYWKWVEILAESFGYSKAEMHEALLGEFSYPMTYKNISGKPSRRVLRTSEMTTKDMKNYMDDIKIFADEHGIILPLPDDKYLINNKAILEYGKK